MRGKVPNSSYQWGNRIVTVAYLTNQYPTTSHSFIRREIIALEALGLGVERYSIRSTAGAYVDARDAEESAKTKVILGNWVPMAGALGRVAAKRPARFASAAQLTSRLALHSDRGWVPHAAYLAEACVLLECIEATPVQHLHAHFGTNSATVAALCHQLGGPPYSFTVHGPEEFDRAAVIGLKEKVIGARFVVAISEFGRSQLCRLVGREHWGKIHVVRCGLQDDLLKSAPTPVTNRARFVCVGRLHEQKGQFVLLDAAAELVARGYEFQVVLAGDGPLRAAIEQRIAELGLGARVSITGWLTEQQVIAELQASAALLLPSFAEGLPVVIMEAFALGRPVVTTFVAGIPELVVPGVNGWMVPAGAVEPLVDAMVQVLSSSAERLGEMGQHGRLAVQERHDVMVSAIQLSKLIGAVS